MNDKRDTGTQHKLRMPPELKEKLFESAKNMNRSLNAEIVARLDKSFSEKQINLDDLTIKDFDALFKKYHQQHFEMLKEIENKR